MYSCADLSWRFSALLRSHATRLQFFTSARAVSNLRALCCVRLAVPRARGGALVEPRAAGARHKLIYAAVLPAFFVSINAVKRSNR